MGSLDAMIIPYLGLADGEYQYDYKVDKAFFSHFEKSKIEEGSFEVDVMVEKRNRMVVLQITADGTMRAACDRCLVDIDIPISYDDRLILKVQEAPDSPDDDVYYLDPQTSHIDLSTYIYESIHIHIPMQYVRDCDAEDYIHCDHDALDALDHTPDQPQEKESGDKEDPWQALKGLNLD